MTKSKSVVTVNGVTYEGSGDVIVSTDNVNGRIIIGDVVHGASFSHNVKIDIKVDGDVTTLHTTSGDVECLNAHNVNTTSGDINIKNEVYGNVNTTSGDVRTKSVKGRVSTVSGDIGL